MRLINRLLFILFALILACLAIYIFTFTEGWISETFIQIISIVGFILALIDFIRKK